MVQTCIKPNCMVFFCLLPWHWTVNYRTSQLFDKKTSFWSSTLRLPSNVSLSHAILVTTFYRRAEILTEYSGFDGTVHKCVIAPVHSWTNNFRISENGNVFTAHVIAAETVRDCHLDIFTSVHLQMRVLCICDALISWSAVFWTNLSRRRQNEWCF